MSKKLRRRQAEMIRLFLEFGFTQQECADVYEVSLDTIRNIANGVSFKPPVSRRKDRKLSDDEIRQVHVWGAKGHKEQKISTLLHGKVSRSTVRQILAGKSYQDVK